jgi:DNA-binding MarR family transcriptional regulator
MDHKDLRTLQILEEIGGDYLPSQRYLARKLNVSLGLINSFVKRLAHKGYFKISTIPKNRVKYILTPKGATEKTRLTYEYVQQSYRFYKETRQKLRKLFDELLELGIGRLVFYGANELAEIAFVSLHETPIELVAVVDDRKIGEKFLGDVVQDAASLRELSFDRVLITAVGSREKILKRILEIGVSRSKLLMLK